MSTKKVTILDLQERKASARPITMLTAYDYPSAQRVDASGVDVALVGDSLAMVVLGHPTTVAVTMDEMLHHCRAVARGASRALLVGDMPFMAYQADRAEAVRNAGRFLKVGGMDAVKLEGGRAVADTARAIVRAGIPVMGHVGLTPQSLSQLGGYRVQGKTAAAALELLEDALALEDAGCFAVVLELVPTPVASAISERLSVPTIGIGAGAGCDGQVLVFHDLLGLYSDFEPRFVKRFARLGEEIDAALGRYRDEVEARTFPAEEHGYSMADGELARFRRAIDGLPPRRRPATEPRAEAAAASGEQPVYRAEPAPVNGR